MAQQRARVLAMRARKLAAKKAAEAAKKLASEKSQRELNPTFSASGAKLQKPKARPKATFSASGAKLEKPKAKLNAEFSASGARLVKPNATQKANQAKTSNNVKPSPKAQPSTSTKTGGTKPVQQAKSRVPQRFADGGKGGKYAKVVENKEKAKSNFFRSSSGTRGENVSPNPKLKSQPTKPKRSSFPAGRAGATEYAAALAKYRKLLARISKVRPQTNRRGRAI